MTDYEIFDLIGMLQIKLAIWVIFLAVILSVYLRVAYVIGKDLPRQQAVIITVLMLLFSFIAVPKIYGGFQMLIEMREAAFFGYTRLKGEAVFKWLVTLGCSLAPLICVKFMSHVRHPPLQGRRRQQQE
jgi:hypothetical protein